METITILFILLAASYALSQVAKRIKMPQLMGPLAVGVILSLFFKDTLGDIDFLKAFADLGLVFIMFYVGLELDLKSFRKKSSSTLSISFFNILVPLVFTFLVMRLLGFSNPVSLIMGLILSVTAEALSIDILKELGILKSRIGQTIVLSATLDDFVEVFLLSGLTAYVEKGDQTFIVIMFNILIFFTLIYATRFLIIPYIIEYLGDDSKSQLFIIGTLMVLLVAVVAEYLGFGSLIGALIAGIVVKYTYLEAEEYKEKKDMTDMFEAVTFGFLAPFFFIWVGLNTDFLLIIKAPMLGIVLTVLAIGTKVIGSLIGNHIAKGSMMEGLTIGVAMSSQGVVELVAAEIARASGLINQELFVAIVFMTVMTTMLSAIFLKILLKRINTS